MVETSLIIPCLNEESSIEETLTCIEKQSVKPNEVIFVDAGSVDQTKKLINEYEKNSTLDISIIEKSGALPGAARNIGVKSAQYDYILFLDCGILPDKDWIKSLLEFSKDNSTLFSWGKCKFLGRSQFQNLLCAYSNGQGTVALNTVPGSMFHKDIFKSVGFFREDLRAAEDTLWRNNFFTVMGPSQTSAGLINYSSYGTSLWNTLKKWFLYSKHTAISKTHKKHQVIYLLFFMILFTSVLIDLKQTSLLLISYFILRGVIDPIRRSQQRVWFSRRVHLFFLGPFFVFLIDSAKFLGFIAGYLSVSRKGN